MLHPAHIAAVWKQRHMPRVETQCINTSSRPKRSNPPSSYGGGILLCSFCVVYMQKDRKKQQYLQRLKMLKTRMNKGKTRISAGFSLSCCTTVDFCLHAKNQFTRVHDIKKSAERALLKFQVE